MYGKIFKTIYDSSVAEDWQTRIVLQDMVVLADINGVVDMTPEAIARRTNVPLEIVKRGIAELEKPDPRSRNPDHDGRRIARVDDHRDWGWQIINYDYYRQIASEEQRREKTLARVHRFRAKACNAPVTPGNACNAPVTPVNACNAMQKQKQRENYKASPTKDCKALAGEESELADRFKAALGEQWKDTEGNGDAGKWVSRVKSAPDKCERVIAEVESAAAEQRIKTTPAQYAEQIWKEFG